METPEVLSSQVLTCDEKGFVAKVVTETQGTIHARFNSITELFKRPNQICRDDSGIDSQ